MQTIKKRDGQEQIVKAIAHFEGLQKRYRKQHNGKMCEYVKLALIGLNDMLPNPDCKECMNGKYPELIWGGQRSTNNYCPFCGRKLKVNY